MRGLLFITAILAANPEPSRIDREFRVERGYGRAGVKAYAFLEFAPDNGAGMGTACACTTPTGAKGEAMTFARTSSATCTKTATGGLATTGIADGDLVTCSSGQPRVEYDSEGYLGLLVESSRQNIIPRSEEFDNAAWVSTNNATTAAAASADHAASPDGNSTADRLTTGVCSSVGLYSFLYNQTTTSTAGLHVGSVYVKGTSGSGAVSLCVTDLSSSTGDCVTAPYVSTEWRRYSVAHNSGVAGTAVRLEVGCLNLANRTGSGSTGAADVLVWGGQLEAGAYATSYIPTTAAAATRQAESASLTLTAAVGPVFSMAASASWPSSSVGAVTVAKLGSAAPDLATIGRNTNTAAAFTINATSTTPAVSAIGTTTQRIALADDGATESAFWQSSSVSAPNGDMSAGNTAFSLGVFDGVVSRVCIDPADSRCR